MWIQLLKLCSLANNVVWTYICLCHLVVLLVVLFKNQNPHVPVPLHLTGSNSCNSLFSMVDGMGVWSVHTIVMRLFGVPILWTNCQWWSTDQTCWGFGQVHNIIETFGSNCTCHWLNEKCLTSLTAIQLQHKTWSQAPLKGMICVKLDGRVMNMVLSSFIRDEILIWQAIGNWKSL